MDKILSLVTSALGGGKLSDSLFELFKGNKQKQREFELQLAEQLASKFGEEIKDLQDARKMQIEALKQSDKFSKRFVYYLTAFLILSTVIVTFLPFFLNFPQENMNEIKRSTDFLYTVTGARIISFFFGTKSTTNV